MPPQWQNMTPAKPLSLRHALVLTLLLAALDQLSKIAIVDWAGFATHETMAVLPFLDFTLIWNYGISYGLFDEGGDAGRYALIILSVLAIGVFIYLMRGAENLRLSAAYALIAGGALGNLIDRLWHGAVVDFISLHAAGYYWYVFNLADIWISAAVIILIYDALRD
jgi:signal peptidase II